MAKQTSGIKWYNTPKGAAGVVLLSALATYLIGSRAIFTGSLQQYVLAFIALVLAVNRSIRLCLIAVKKGKAAK
ncbi:MAG TPA: hypothetical protein VLG16_00095 [Candidatus Saccharimonadales bacterium]|nr:hypothetical protein [Candidatus Saccharimonadales bacterium]